MGLIVDWFFGDKSKDAQEKAANKGIEASKYATDKTIKYLTETRDQIRTDNEPWRQAGTRALGRLEGLSTNPNAFQADPGYQWRFQQGVDAVDRSAAASGRLNSGGTMKALTRYGQGFGSQEFQNVWNRQAGLAGVGQTANAANASAGQNFANGAGNAMFNHAQNRISGYNQIGNAQSNFWGGLHGSLNSYGNMFANLMGGF